MKKISSLLLSVSFALPAIAQPYVDVIQANSQWLFTRYTHSGDRNVTNNSFLNVIIPKKLGNDRVVFARFHSEMLYSAISGDTAYNHTVYGFTLPLGYQFPLGKSRFSMLLMAMPKISSDLEDKLGKEDVQMGGAAVFYWKKNERLKLKAGLFYNRECFGNFFVPLLGADWKASDRFQLYGLLPQFFRAEYRLARKLFTGVGFRFYGRSYRLSSRMHNDYLWNQENQVKLFLDYHIRPKWVIYAEVSRSLGFGPYQVPDRYEKEERAFTTPLYSALNDGYFINFGTAFRIRNDY